MLETTHKGTFQNPLNTVPQTWVDSFSVDCVLTQASSRDLTWARFSGVSYEYKLVFVTSVIVTEDWRVVIDTVTYAVKTVNRKYGPNGYSHTVLGLSKI